MTSSDQRILERQLKILSSLWDDVMFQTRLRLAHLIELLENLEKFAETWKLLDGWLTKSEKSLLKDIESAGNPQKQKEKIQSVRMYISVVLAFAVLCLGFSLHFLFALSNQIILSL